MNLQISQESFSKSLAFAAKFTNTRAQLPVLGNILLKAENNKLILVSTNLETSISIILGAKVESPGSITVPSRVISELVSNLPKGNIDLSLEKEQLNVSCLGVKSRISGMNSADFPVVNHNFNSESSITLSQKTLLDSLGKVLFACSIDESRPSLTGVLFEFSEKYLTLVATDGFRLSRRVIDLKSKAKDIKLILPRFVLSEISKVEGDEIQFEYKEKENQILFKFDNVIISSRVIEGEFPDYEKIVPKGKSIKVFIDKEDFFRAIKLSGVFAKDASNIVNIAFLKDSLEVSSESQDLGSQNTRVEAKIESDTKLDDFRIAFNYHYMEDFMSKIDTDEIILGFNTPNSAGVFEDPKDPSFLHLIMPVRIQS